mmetsp:Transcript_30879/g.72068  ORF Transcript_30879/g.72068 Transcript_30879/m.72068 type:complete len:129 (+) Transcript_30879:135-521(+)
MAWTLKVSRALSGEALCELDLPPSATVWQVREYIEKATGIPRHTQRLLIGAEECNRRGELMLDCLAGRCPEVQLVVREYARREMQAAWLIEGWWNRRKTADDEEVDEEGADPAEDDGAAVYDVEPADE